MRFFSASSFAWQGNKKMPRSVAYCMHCFKPHCMEHFFENLSLDLGTALVFLAPFFILLLALLLGDAAGLFLLLLA